MMRIKKYCMMTLMLFFGLTGFAFAHTLWLNASDYTPKVYPAFGAKTKIYFGWGHRYPVDDFLSADSLVDYALFGPDGDRQKLSPNPGGFLATPVSLKKQGAYQVGASLRPGFYTIYEQNGKTHHKIGPKTGLEGVVMSLYYEEYAKALILAGQAPDDTFKKAIGHNLEIIPLRRPSEIRQGDFLPVQVLFEGRPARYCKVNGTFSGFASNSDFAYSTTTNAEGEAKIRILQHGVWLVKAEMKLPATEELKEKCNERSYSATLTFEVP
jgi:uncharacterized GH25 family protein